MPEHFIRMSNSQYLAVGAAESLDAGSEEAMDVEDGQSSETKTPVAGMPDACWVKLGPHHGPQAAGDNELAVPATQSVIDESGVLASKTHEEQVQSIEDLKRKVTLLTHRVGTLEVEMQELKSSAASQPSHSASASQQPQDDAMAASSASGSCQNKRKTRQQYRVPMHKPWAMNSGTCHSCRRGWSTAESKANFQVDRHAWQQAMNKLFEGFESTKEGLEGGLWDFIEDSVGTPYNVQNSLVSCEILTKEQGEDFSNLMAEKLWQPDVDDDRCWFLYRGGEKASRYITFGCVTCQRGTTLHYRSGTFWTDFRKYFQ